MTSTEMSAEDRRYSGLVRPVPGFPGYSVGVWGEVFSPRRMLPLKGGLTRGYRHVTLYAEGGRKKTFRVHRLVLELFVGPCPEGMECRHLNGIPDDNRLKNLQWSTHQENCSDRRLHGTELSGEKATNVKLTAAEVRAMKQRLLLLESCSSIAKDFGVSRYTVQNIAAGRVWKGVGADTSHIDRVKKSRNGPAVLTESQASEAKGMLLDGMSCIDIGKRLGVCRTTIGCIKSGRTWRDVEPKRRRIWALPEGES